MFLFYSCIKEHYQIHVNEKKSYLRNLQKYKTAVQRSLCVSIRSGPNYTPENEKRGTTIRK